VADVSIAINLIAIIAANCDTLPGRVKNGIDFTLLAIALPFELFMLILREAQRPGRGSAPRARSDSRMCPLLGSRHPWGAYLAGMSEQAPH
jgi:hypothetical protein